MRKTWVKREHIYYRPFYKQKTKMILLGLFLLGIIFFGYQIFYINQLPISSTPLSNMDSTVTVKDIFPSPSFSPKSEEIKIIRGIRLRDYDAYKPSFDGLFHCLSGNKKISFDKVNDNYCDCLDDGSDEPSTNACSNGKFYCKFQKRHITGRGRDVFIPSSRINDGICDCCDGSDEWFYKICKNSCL